jgi:hypothetical protein
MRRESHRRRGVSRASSGGWGHRAVYVGAVVATAAVIAGFGAAVLIYGPIGAPYRQLSGSTLGAPPTGVSFGNGQELLASGLPLTGTGGATNWSWSNTTTGNFSGPCQASGAEAGGVHYNATNASTAAPITPGNDTLVCLNSVLNGTLNSTWWAGLGPACYLTSATYGKTGIPCGQNYSANGQNVSSCNNFTAPAGGQPWQSPWNLTHIDNASFTPCQTFYQQNNNTGILPSFVGLNNSTAWVTNSTGNATQMGYLGADVVYEITANFTNKSTNGTFEVSVAITGVTPVAQEFFFNNTVHGGASNGTVVFVFDMTAAWLYDASYNYSGNVTNSSLPEIYGAVGLTSVVITECSGNGVCPRQS